MAAPSTAFSYAQAAKGQGASPSTASPNLVSQSQTPQDAASASPALGTPPVQPLDGAALRVADKLDVESTVGSESEHRSETTADRRSESRRDDDSTRLDRPWRRADKTDTRSSSTTTRSVDDQDSRRTRKSKKSKAPSDKLGTDQAPVTDKEKDAGPENPKVELAEAPIPSINIWQQRKEQQTRSKPPVADAASTAATASQDSAVTTATASPKDAAATTDVVKESKPANGVKPSRKVSESTRPERNGTRGNRTVEKDGRVEVPPPVQDATLWPTPEIAIKEDKKKPTSDKQQQPAVQEPKDQAQDDISQVKPRPKDKWVTYDYVPTVSFATQLPQMRNSKPRGGARGGGNTRSSTGSQAGDKPASNTQGAKPSEAKDRSRDSTVSSTSRNTSQPPSSKRVSVDTSSVTVKEQKKATGQQGEKNKDAAPAPSSEQSQNSRERGEGRADRARGGYRGRGGHQSMNSHAQHQHNNANFAAGGSQSRPQGPYSPPPRQSPHGQMFMPPPQRGSRGRNGGNGTNYHHRMSLPNGTTRLQTMQPQFGSYEYPMAPLSAMQFQPQPYWDNVVMTLLKNQIEYYFSIENLCKDMYLRKRMDSQGFVNLHFIAAFKRIRELTSDMSMLRAVCEASTEIDFVVGEDDIERLRRRSSWDNFVLPMKDRDDFARTNGPSQVTYKNRSYNFGPQFNGGMPMQFGMPPHIGFSPQGDGHFAPFADGTQAGQPSQEMPNMPNGQSANHIAGTQLSAEVPDFAPAEPATTTKKASPEAVNGTAESQPALTNGIHAE